MVDSTQSLRAALEALRGAGALHTVEVEVDPEYELRTILSRSGGGPAIFFENVKDFRIPVVGNLLSSRAKIALLLGVPEDELQARLVDALDHSVAPVVVAEGPCQERVVLDGIDLRRMLPVGKQFELESGAYINSAVVIARDPATGARNVSINRALVVGPDRLMIGMAPSHHLIRLAKRAWEVGAALPLTLSIGNHPAVVMASNAYVHFGEDELGIAGAMLGEPIRLVRTKVIDGEAPAEAEMVIEAELYPGERLDEGLVTEFHGLYEQYGESPIARVRAVTHRHDLIYQDIASGRSAEHMLIGGEMIGATALRAIREAVPSARRVCITTGGAGRMHCVISLHEPPTGDGRRAVFAALAHASVIKQVVVVDDDIDVTSPVEVEWAISTRFRAERDLMLLPGVRGDRSDPVEENRTVTKWAMIALKDEKTPPEQREAARAPLETLAKVERRWPEYFGLG